MKTKLTESQKNKIAIVGLSFIALCFVLPWLFGTIALAYDSMVENSLETSLNENVKAVEQSIKSCKAAHASLLAWKQENDRKVVGGNPCAGF